MLTLHKRDQSLNGSVRITGSKSESNRLLILQALYPGQIRIENLSNAADTEVLQKILSISNGLIDVHHSGTAMRFLTAYFASKPGRDVVLVGSERMKQRPIAILVDALRKLGAKIDYLESEGCPPLKIRGRRLQGGRIEMNAQVSSQYISALMLIASSFENGLEIVLSGKLISLPYLRMTFDLLQKAGVECFWQDRCIRISLCRLVGEKSFSVESDWSSASYYYALTALSRDCKLNLSLYKKDSLQGDHAISTIYRENFGVDTVFDGEWIHLNKNSCYALPDRIELDLNATPDVAQTIAVTCAGLQIKCLLTGLETLKIKETDRLQALQNELTKVGSEVRVTADALELINFRPRQVDFCIKTYQDHRMAMAFASLGLCYPIRIYRPEVVEKSYPTFWTDLQGLGFSIDRK
ncbi:MAG: 3-phosphoshikimate 1-carboxyvinyltransferase [Flavobacteriales bacterium AspAUS03]